MKTRLVLITLATFLILALALVSGFVLIFRLFLIWVLLLLAGFLWAFFGVRGLDGQARKPGERVQVGEWFTEENTVSNRSRMPRLLVRVDEVTDFPGHENVAVFSLAPGKSHSWHTKVYCRRRGYYHLGAMTATVTDPLGLFSWHRKLGTALDMLVLPATLELPYFEPLSRNEPAYGRGRWLTSETFGPDAARVREYTHGDTFRRIHWQSTAHAGKLMVKEFDPDRSGYATNDVWIIPDMDRSVQLGEGDETTEEYCITIAASVFKTCAMGGKQVGLLASADRPYLFNPDAEDPHLWHILEALALMKASGDLPVEQLVSREIERFGINSAVIIITPSVSERLAATLRQLKNRGVMALVVLLDGASFGGTATSSASLATNGFGVYVVRRGDDISKALDSRAASRRLIYAGGTALNNGGRQR